MARRFRFVPALVALVSAVAAAQGDERAEEDGSRLIVLNKAAASAWLVDPATGERTGELETGVGPHEAAVSPAGDRLVVGDYGAREPGNTLHVFALPSGAHERTIDLGELTRPHGLAFLPDGRLLVTAEGARALVEVDVAAGEVLRVVTTGAEVSHMVAVAPGRGRAYVANIGAGSVSVVDLESFELVRNVETGAGAEGVAVRPGEAEVWVTNRGADTVTVLDAGSLEELAEIAVTGFPIRVSFTPDGARALVTAPREGDVALIDAESRSISKRVPIRLEVPGDADTLFGDAFGESPTPIGILVRPDGRVAYVATSRADRIAVLDLETLEVRAALPTGREPDGMAWYAGPPPSSR